LLFSLIVIVKALEVKHVPLKLVLGFLPFFLLSCKLCVLLFCLKHVTLVVPAGCRSVLFPVAQTNPAKLVHTTRCSASHMIATLVLFNSSLAFWTWLRVCHNPCEVFGLCCVLLQPFLHNITVTRLMALLGALQTCFLSTGTFNKL
jgi:hypothetical protein